MVTRTITYAVCDGDHGKCGRELRAPGDGLVFHGLVYLGGPRTTGTRPIVGSDSDARSGDSNETALCWDCFRAVAPDPHIVVCARRIVELETERDRHVCDTEPYRGGSPTGPLPPPELPGQGAR